MKERDEIDAWMRQVHRRARDYMAQGVSAEKAEEMAVDDIRREIRNGPPIKSMS